MCDVLNGMLFTTLSIAERRSNAQFRLNFDKSISSNAPSVLLPSTSGVLLYGLGRTIALEFTLIPSYKVAFKQAGRAFMCLNSSTSYSLPANHPATTTMLLVVSVPVLSLQMSVILPIVSTAAKVRTRFWSFSIFLVAWARDMVTARGRPSGMATTTMVVATMNPRRT